ncbi:hypothetical protein WDH52_12460 [Streptomyces sp. TRM70308]|uniref:hypothetical protein n=1 Tax=Streptomyces sp. TRM70308 TaxID=3131932 RepID=UPI003D028ED1
MKRVRTGWLARRRRSARGGEAPGAPAATVPLAEGLARCAAHADALAGSGDRHRRDRAAALRRLLSEHPEAAALPPGWSTARPALLDALLAAGEAALAGEQEDGLRLAVTIADTVLTERGGSRGGWRLRARALDALGEDVTAAAAWERYLALRPEPVPELSARAAGLRASAAHRGELLRELRERYPRAAEFTGGGATELWADGLARDAAGDWAGAAPRLVAALRTMAERPLHAAETSAALTEFMDRFLLRHREETGGPLTGCAALFAHYADHVRLRAQAPVPDPTLGAARAVGVGDLRSLVAGRSVCVVAEGSSGESAGDGYDLVVRCDAFRPGRAGPGARADLHVTTPAAPDGWAEPVGTRIILCEQDEPWKRAVRERLVPGAQHRVGDASLRWPLRTLGGGPWPASPGTALHVLWLLDFLDVCPRLDAVGLGLPDRPHERDWLAARATDRTDTRISLR